MLVERALSLTGNLCKLRPTAPHSPQEILDTLKVDTADVVVWFHVFTALAAAALLITWDPFSDDHPLQHHADVLGSLHV